jgi:hypothetical protein
VSPFFRGPSEFAIRDQVALDLCRGRVLGFDETRKRNLKWKNRKHRVPLHEGRLWLQRT